MAGGGSPGGAGGDTSPLTTKGDLYTYSTGGARLPVGTNGQILVADSTTSTGLRWESVSPTTDTTAWHNNLDTFGSAKKIGTVDDFGFAIYSHNKNIGTFFDPRGAGAIDANSGMAFLSSLSVPGDSIYWLKNLDATPSASSSCELQFNSDVATLQIFTLNSNNPPRAPGNPSYDMASNEAAVFCYDNPLDIGTGLDHPIQFILDGARMCYMDKTGIIPQVDGLIATTSLGSSSLTWDTVFAQEGVFRYNLSSGTFGGATTEGEFIGGKASSFSYRFYLSGTTAIYKFTGAPGGDTELTITSQGGAGAGHAAGIVTINTDGLAVYQFLADSGFATTFAGKVDYHTIAGGTGIGVRVNVNQLDNSGWAIDSSGNMTVYAVQLGLYGHATVAQQTVTGSRVSGAALVDLLTKLAATGIIVDGTTP